MGRRTAIPAAVALLLAVVVLLIVLRPTGTPRAPRPRQVFRGAFSQVNAQFGTLVRTRHAGRPAFRAEFRGGAVNGYERGIFNVSWRMGDAVTYAADFFLPQGFTRDVQGEVDLMRWDNFPAHPADTDWGGLVIFHGDRRARLMRFDKAGTGSSELTRPIRLPEGRWFRAEVRQTLSDDGNAARSELLLDGRLVGRSTKPNAYGRDIERVRYGIVAVDAGRQRRPLRLWFSRARAYRAAG